MMITQRWWPVLAVVLGCAGQTTPDGPWRDTAVSPNTADGIRVLVLHDMEGLSGQDDPRTFSFSEPEFYARGQEMLAADLNAVIDGLYAGGATDVFVVDGHGSGNPDPDVRRDLLDPRATQILRDEPFDAYLDLPELESFDAVAVVGMHAKTGSEGFASHTFTLGIGFLVHGRAITETELVALSWGRFGTPVIFASGDDRLAADLETMPWIEFVTVKHATSASTAIPRPVEEARADLRDGARRAVENLESARVLEVSTPIRAGLLAVPPADLSFLDGVPGVPYEDGVYRFVSEDLHEAYDGLVALVGVAARGYQDVLIETLRERPDAEAIYDAYRDALTQRWFAQESGEYARPSTMSASEGRRYHGYR